MSKFPEHKGKEGCQQKTKTVRDAKIPKEPQQVQQDQFKRFH